MALPAGSNGPGRPACALPAIARFERRGHLIPPCRPLGSSGTAFSEQFRKWCDEAGLSRRCTVHGLRKAGCRRLAEAGASANEIAAWSGHLTLREVERYTRAADQLRLARNAHDRNAPATKVSGKS